MSGSGISWAICKSAPRSRQITTPAPHRCFFTGRMPFLPPNQQCQSTEGPAWPKTNLVHSKAVRKPLVAIIFSILKCMFYSCHLSWVPWRHRSVAQMGAGGCSPPPLNPPLSTTTHAPRLRRSSPWISYRSRSDSPLTTPLLPRFARLIHHFHLHSFTSVPKQATCFTNPFYHAQVSSALHHDWLCSRPANPWSPGKHRSSATNVIYTKSPTDIFLKIWPHLSV